MRCSEARGRLDDLSRLDDLDPALQEHVRHCSACAQYLAVAQALQADLKQAAIDDDSVPLTFVRKKTEMLLSERRKTNKERSIMAKLTSQLNRRPRLTYGMVALVVILAVATLVPFKYNKTVGYEVAIAGVQPDLALDVDRIDVMLNALGMAEASIDIKDCDPTCTVTISQLTNESDAKIVCKAFEKIEGGKIVVDLVELKGVDKATFFTEAKNVFVGQDFEFISDEDADHIVAQCVDSLNKSYEYTFSVCKPADGEEASFTYSAEGDNVFFVNPEDCDKQTMELALASMKDCSHRFCIDDEGNVHADGETCNKCTIKVEHILREAADGDTVEEDIPAAKTTGELPEGFALNQNYPNPFNPTTNISFVLPEAKEVRLEIYNVRGQRVARLLDQAMSAGEHTIEWNGTTDGGSHVASGVYFYRISAGGFTDTRKMTLLK